jgi:hypothetical protein
VPSGTISDSDEISASLRRRRQKYPRDWRGQSFAQIGNYLEEVRSLSSNVTATQGREEVELLSKLKIGVTSESIFWTEDGIIREF